MLKKLLPILSLLPTLAFADAPEILKKSLDAYLKNGREAFLPEMLKGSTLEGEKSVLSQANMLGQVEAYYGQAKSWEILATCELTDRVKTTYYIVYYDKGPVYGMLESYKLENGTTIATRFKFHTEQVQIFPYTPIVKKNICDA